MIGTYVRPCTATQVVRAASSGPDLGGTWLCHLAVQQLAATQLLIADEGSSRSGSNVAHEMLFLRLPVCTASMAGKSNNTVGISLELEKTTNDMNQHMT